VDRFRDTTALRAKLRSRDVDQQRFALLELGRFELPALIPVIMPSLQNPQSEVRAQAADAIGQAAQSWRAAPPPRRGAVSPESVVEALVARLKDRVGALVRASIAETIGRVPYATAEQVATATQILVQVAPTDTVTDRLGVATGLDDLVRFKPQPAARPIGPDREAARPCDVPIQAAMLACAGWPSRRLPVLAS